jgi:hypothetical protein
MKGVPSLQRRPKTPRQKFKSVLDQHHIPVPVMDCPVIISWRTCPRLAEANLLLATQSVHPVEKRCYRVYGNGLGDFGGIVRFNLFKCPLTFERFDNFVHGDISSSRVLNVNPSMLGILTNLHITSRLFK